MFFYRMTKLARVPAVPARKTELLDKQSHYRDGRTDLYQTRSIVNRKAFKNGN